MRQHKQRKCPICGSGRYEPVNRTNDGMTLMACASCGQREKVNSED